MELKLNAVFSRKEPEFRPEECVAGKVVELTGAEYARFRSNMLDDYGFIAENLDQMYMDTEEVRHCLLVIGEGHDDGVLIDSAGATYARYAALVPKARAIVENETRPVCLKDLERSLTAAADEIVADCASSVYNPTCIYYPEYMDRHSLREDYHVALLADVISERPEISGVDIEVGQEYVIETNMPKQASREQDAQAKRTEHLLDRTLKWLSESESGANLYDTLSEVIGMTDDEILKYGFDGLEEHMEMENDVDGGLVQEM